VISDLGVGPNAWLMNTVLVVSAILLLGPAVAFLQGTRDVLGGRARRLDAALLALSPIGFGVAGIFTEAPATLAIHWLVGADLAFFGPVLAFSVIGVQLLRHRESRRWGTASLAAGVATLVLVLFMFWIFTPGTALAPQHLGGLMERIVVVAILAAYAATGLRLLATGRQTGTRRRGVPAIGRLFRTLNPIMRSLIRSPLHPLMSRRLLVITYTGRRTGRRYSTPIAYVPDGETILIAGGAPWWRNIGTDSTVSVRLRGRERAARVERLEDLDSVMGALRFVLPRNPTLGRFMRLEVGPDGTLDPVRVQAARARGLSLARLHLIEGSRP
jgi:hypothetical membrane protein